MIGKPVPWDEEPPLDPAGSAMENSYVERHEESWRLGGDAGRREKRSGIEDSRRGARRTRRRAPVPVQPAENV